jgi:hypothetical protein
MFTTCAAIAVASAMAWGAEAATIHTTITFEDSDVPDSVPNAEGSSFVLDGYKVSPINLQNGQCDVDPCTKESSVKVPDPENPEKDIQDQILSGIERVDAPDTFDLLGFWFSLEGQGSKPTKDVTLYGFQGETVTKTIVFSIDKLFSDLLGEGASLIGGIGDSGTGKDPDPECLDTKICDGVGYAVTLTGWTDLTRVLWDVEREGNSSLDTIKLRRDGDTPPPVVPLPAAGWLLIAGVGGLAALKRKKRAA